MLGQRWTAPLVHLLGVGIQAEFDVGEWGGKIDVTFGRGDADGLARGASLAFVGQVDLDGEFLGFLVDCDFDVFHVVPPFEFDGWRFLRLGAAESGITDNRLCLIIPNCKPFVKHLGDYFGRCHDLSRGFQIVN